MTTTPNDAAVNAEQAAKPEWWTTHEDEIIRDIEVMTRAEGWWDKMLAAAALRIIKRLRQDIERHATAQTQSTHGEDEATHWRYYSPDPSKRNANPWHRFADEKPDEKLVIDYGFDIAPSRTAAPASVGNRSHLRV